jgi:hypothetical protein
MWVKYDHHLLTGEKLLVAHLFFLKKPRAVNNNAFPPANPSALHKHSSQQPKIQGGIPGMRGIRPTNAIEEAQRCTEKMGYHWIKKTPIRNGSSMHCSGRQ